MQWKVRELSQPYVCYLMLQADFKLSSVFNKDIADEDA